jgi:hypothetical protein
MELQTKSIDKEDTSASKGFEKMVAAYLASNPVMSQNRKTSELEVRFGTNPRLARPISKIDYENVVKQLHASGFTTSDPDGMHMLRIQNEYYDIRSQATKVSNIRAEIVGLDLIQEYCKSNSLQKLIDMPSTSTSRGNKIKFTQKSPPLQGTQQGQGTSDGPMRPVDFTDYNFRVAYQMEQDYTVEWNIAKNILNKWTDSKKLFRYINRVRFSHPTLPIFADLSILRVSPKIGKKTPVPHYTVQDAKLFQNRFPY